MTLQSQKGIHGQGGQVIIEYILMLVVAVTMSMLLSKYLKDSKFLENFAFQPWEKLNGMAQCGAWTKCGVETPAANIHPNTSARILSIDPGKNP